MLNNITNFFNLIKTGMVKSQLESSDLLPIGTRDSRYGGSYKPTMVKYSDLAAQILSGVPPLTIGITPIVSGTAGKLLYEGVGNVLNESPVFNIDPLTGYLGAGTTTPQFAIDMQYNSLGFYSGPTYYASLGLNNGSFYLTSYSDFVFGTSVVGNPLTIKQNGNVLINTGADAGYKLDVNGTVRVQGDTTISNGNNILLQTTSAVESNVGIGWQVAGGQERAFLRLNWNSGEFKIGGGGSGYFPTFYSMGTERMRIDTSGNVGIGTSSPVSRLHLGTSVGSLATGLTFGSGVSGIWLLDNTTMGIKINSVDKFWFRATDFYPDASLSLELGISSRRWKGLYTQQITDNGSNVLIGTTTDAGFRLDVSGTARVSSRFTIGSDIIPSAAGSSVALAAHVAAGSILDLSYYTGSQNALSSTKSVIFHGITFSPSSGTAIFNQLNIAPILNQTGTANGAVRGFYYNPTVTSVLGSHWAIHTTAGRVRFEGLPTSSAGLSSGDIWNDGGILKIV